MGDVSLSAKERHQLLAVLRELDQGAPPEKRQMPRQSALLRIRICVIKGKRKTASLVATVRDVAPRGIGLILRSPLEKKSKIIVPLKFREGGGWLILCEVRNCSDWQNGQFLVGARFLDRIDDPDGKAQPPMDWLL